jgi:hypothetical protein
MKYDERRAIALIEEAAHWAISPEVEPVRDKFEPLARYIAEVSELAVEKVLIMVEKALEAGYYYGKYGFPEDRIPDAFKDAFNEVNNGK